MPLAPDKQMEIKRKLKAKGWSDKDIVEVLGSDPTAAMDGDASMDPMTAARIVKYLVSKLSPDDRAELDEMLGREAPDLAQDISNGRLSFDRAPAFVRKKFTSRPTSPDAATAASFGERFPDAARIGTTL